MARSQWAGRGSSRPWASWYSSARWRALRLRILARDLYTCQMSGVLLGTGRSGASGLIRPAVIDHLIPHRGDEALFFDPSNLWAVSADMHDAVCQAIEGRPGITGPAIRAAKIAHREVGLDGYPTRPPDRWVDRQF